MIHLEDLETPHQPARTKLLFLLVHSQKCRWRRAQEKISLCYWLFLVWTVGTRSRVLPNMRQKRCATNCQPPKCTRGKKTGTLSYTLPSSSTKIQRGKWTQKAASNSNTSAAYTWRPSMAYPLKCIIDGPCGRRIPQILAPIHIGFVRPNLVLYKCTAHFAALTCVFHGSLFHWRFAMNWLVMQ